MREYALSVREHTSFISLDDKHKIQIGEPLYPVAALESGRQVLVTEDERFIVGDHDFTKSSIIPSVCFVITIPELMVQRYVHHVHALIIF